MVLFNGASRCKIRTSLIIIVKFGAGLAPAFEMVSVIMSLILARILIEILSIYSSLVLIELKRVLGHLRILDRQVFATNHSSCSVIYVSAHELRVNNNIWLQLIGNGRSFLLCVPPLNTSLMSLLDGSNVVKWLLSTEWLLQIAIATSILLIVEGNVDYFPLLNLNSLSRALVHFARLDHLPIGATIWMFSNLLVQMTSSVEDYAANYQRFISLWL